MREWPTARQNLFLGAAAKPRSALLRAAQGSILDDEALGAFSPALVGPPRGMFGPPGIL